jgi:hypothetical protein
MLSKPGRIVARLLGVVIALTAAALILTSARPSASTTSSLPASVSVSVALSGELAVVPESPDPFLVSRTLRPEGDPVEESFTVQNQTGKTLGVSFRAAAETRGLDGLLRVRLRAGGALLADTTLQGLRHGTEPLTLGSGAIEAVRMIVWIPPEVTQGYEGQQVEVSLTPELGPAVRGGLAK